MTSITSRLLWAATIIVILFFGITGVTLDRFYQTNAEDAQRNRLLGYFYEMINAIEFSQQGKLAQPRLLPEVRFAIPNSGLYAQITLNDGQIIWTSDSARDLVIPFRYGLSRGTQEFGATKDDKGFEYFYYSFGISWDETTPIPKGYTFTVVESSETFHAEVASFRKGLWGSLAGVALLLLMVQGAILRWGLQPLRQVTDEMKQIESGEKPALAGNYPLEIRRLTDDLNTLLHSHQENLKRNRTAMGDLAHSLKTPLALLRSSAESDSTDPALQKAVNNQVERMSQIIEYQLQRATTAGRSAFAAAIKVEPLLTKILSSLDKVYRDKQVHLRTQISSDVVFYGDRDDLMEITGNLADNAYKWCEKQVIVSIRNINSASTRPGLSISIEDDGPGIPEEKVEQVLQRGIRVDERVNGHGIGLAIVNDICSAYGGKMKISSGLLSGNRVEIVIPGS
ncbi:MAG: ATP-binding protein [Gammaproteobacteria bacterium]|nr:ATP-binding protein [Gammaproteobacteria bacterium]MCF6230863.1 ATP-binding protein [Gammaproteobacteria bacterium]